MVFPFFYFRKDMITLSNMESLAGEVIDDEYVLDIYEPSVKMSTYLLAFIVCEFGSVYDEGNNWGPIKLMGISFSKITLG